MALTLFYPIGRVSGTAWCASKVLAGGEVRVEHLALPLSESWGWCVVGSSSGFILTVEAATGGQTLARCWQGYKFRLGTRVHSGRSWSSLGMRTSRRATTLCISGICGDDRDNNQNIWLVKHLTECSKASVDCQVSPSFRIGPTTRRLTCSPGPQGIVIARCPPTTTMPFTHDTDHAQTPTVVVPDDSTVPTQEAMIQVDYLSHPWLEEDVARSWSNIKSQQSREKNSAADLSNMLRLENASWRTWWKQRNKLKTISPQTLNW